jgi:hypothetical protein
MPAFFCPHVPDLISCASYSIRRVNSYFLANCAPRRDCALYVPEGREPPMKLPPVLSAYAFLIFAVLFALFIYFTR